MIVLLTDFGLGEYVGVMKGVICQHAPDARIVDLCHDVTPQCLVEASWLLSRSYRYFPTGSVFCCVVDPGVGSDRKAVAVQTTRYSFVAPDNGILWETLKLESVVAQREIPVPAEASRTFHGRDLFAQAVAEVDRGKFEALGPATTKLKHLDPPLKGREGLVVRIDRFGNCVTNLPPQGQTHYSVSLGTRRESMPSYPTYDAAEADRLFIIEGSCGTLEISLKNGNANAELHASAGDKIVIE